MRATEGATCPFRHEKPDHQSPELASQNIKDRYYGKNDPVANKMMKKLKEQEKNYEAPPDITTLWINGVLPDRITKSDLHDHFYPFGEIVSIKIAESKNCAFVEYSQHQEALKAIEHLRNDLVIKGQFLRVNWAKPLSQNPDSAAGLEAEDQCNAQPVPIIPPPPGYYGTLPPMMVVSDKFVPLGGENGPHVPPVSAWPVSYYPSMNPNRMGSIPSHRAKAAQTPPAPENPSEATPKGSPAQRPDPLGDGEEARPSGS
ncbi:uncharacterized protein LOC126316686 [Schistocerca gregaria]|uniref:uncharacterized protein LOC126316686 n=1 Tax=Schistocerca gregaria TaxID=7010 RepID=UPI00211E3FED|nr:uncharacterized protein LOC126316686 [Schistocerca gregaria]